MAIDIDRVTSIEPMSKEELDRIKSETPFFSQACKAVGLKEDFDYEVESYFNSHKIQNLRFFLQGAIVGLRFPK